MSDRPMATTGKTLKLFLTLFAGLGAAQAVGADLQLKGVKIGDPPEVACPDSALTNTWQENTVALMKHGIKAKDFDVAQCNPTISRTAGIATDEPAHILFMDGRLIFYKFSLEGVPLEKQSDILQALKGEFGPWKAKHTEQFSHFIWSKNGHELMIERIKRDFAGDDVAFTLRDTAKMRVYMAELDRVTQMLDKQVATERGRSVLEK